MVGEDVYILSGARTPIGKLCSRIKTCVNNNHVGTGNFLGVFQRIPTKHIGACTIREALKRAEINATDVDEVIIGQVGVLKNISIYSMNEMVCKLGVDFWSRAKCGASNCRFSEYPRYSTSLYH